MNIYREREREIHIYVCMHMYIYSLLNFVLVLSRCPEVRAWARPEPLSPRVGRVAKKRTFHVKARPAP